MKSEKQSLSSRVHDSILEMIIDAGAASENMLLTESALTRLRVKHHSENLD